MPPQDIWGDLARLDGKCLKTLEQRRPFTVLAVRETGVILELQTSGKQRQVSRASLQEAYAALYTRRELSLHDVSEAVGANQASYVATLLATLPNVAVCRKPMALIYNGLSLFDLDCYLV